MLKTLITAFAGAAILFVRASIVIEPRQGPATITQTAGTFQYKGCYQDAANATPGNQATLQVELALPPGVGVTAESCTAACQADGFVLAGLKAGSECWCDSYTPLPVLAPDTDCNVVCTADNAELCGAADRIALYVDDSAPPLNTEECLTSSQLREEVFTFDLVGIPGSPNPPIPLGALGFPAGNVAFYNLTASVSGQPHIFSMAINGAPSEIVLVETVIGFPTGFSLQPGISQTVAFEASTTRPIFSGFCALPSFVSASTYIGPPMLGVNNGGPNGGFCNSQSWSLCDVGVEFDANLDNIDATCKAIAIVMTSGLE